MPKLLAPEYGGVWSWEGELLPSTILKLSDGREVSLSSLITLTNGDVLEWLEEQEVEKHLAGQHDQSTHGRGGHNSDDHKHYDPSAYKRNTASPEQIDKILANTHFVSEKGKTQTALEWIDAQTMEQSKYGGFNNTVTGYEEHFKALDHEFGMLTAQNPIQVAVSERALTSILEEGRFKSITELPLSPNGYSVKGDDYVAKRLGYENIAFGYDDSTLPEQRPISGLVLPNRKLPTDVAYSYGEIAIELDHALKTRTTFTIGDSLDNYAEPIQYGYRVPRTVEYKSLASDSYSNERAGGKGTLTNKNWHNDQYVEAQVHGGIKVSDIKSVTFYLPAEKVSAQTAKLDALGIPYKFDTLDDDGSDY